MGRGDVKFSLFFALKVLFHLCALLAIVCVCLGWLITSFDELCDAESSECPVGRYVYRDFVCAGLATGFWKDASEVKNIVILVEN